MDASSAVRCCLAFPPGVAIDQFSGIDDATIHGLDHQLSHLLTEWYLGRWEIRLGVRWGPFLSVSFDGVGLAKSHQKP